MRNGLAIVIASIAIGLNVHPHCAIAHDGSAHSLVNGPDANTVEASPVVGSYEGAVRAVISRYKLWETGSILRACFFSDGTEAKNFFVETAQVWIKSANIGIDFGPIPNFRQCSAASPSHLRIAFEPKGNWSYIGRDSLKTDLSAPSLNIDMSENFSLQNKSYLRGVILHELGHALALEHEHQSPQSSCDKEFNWSEIYSDLGRPPNNWSKAEVDRNMRQLIASPRLRTTQYDPKSVMHYSLPANWFLSGASSKCWTARNDGLSPIDRKIIADIYPPTLAEQARHMAELDIASHNYLKSIGVQESDLSKIQESINNNMDPGLKRNGIKSSLSAPVGINQGSITVIQTQERCSPAIGSVSGTVSVTGNCR